MVCFEFWVNGTRVGVAGVGDQGVLTTTVYGMVKDGAAESIRANVGGVEHPSGQRLNWLNRSLELGDSLMIKVVELESCDEPEIHSAPSIKAVN
jgi:hypothetical protein